MRRLLNRTIVLLALVGFGMMTAPGAKAGPLAQRRAHTDRIIQYWTRDRRAAAMPRHLVIDRRGLGYLRTPAGTLVPYGHDIAANPSVPRITQVPMAGRHGHLHHGRGGGSSGDVTPPAISGMSPAAGDTIGASAVFSATVTDASGVKSVTFQVRSPYSRKPQSFTASEGANNVWSTTLQGFVSGAWSWRVVARDASSNHNIARSPWTSFTVSVTSPASGVVTDAQWTDGGALQTAAGRLYFEMPANRQWHRWDAYVCSGTVVTDTATDRSIILTASHCVFDDVHKAFARNVLFIPNQADTTGAGTDTNCNNDPLGCWVPAFGVVDSHWANSVFPYNAAWDYAYYVVPDSGAHIGTPASTDVLDIAAGSLQIDFAQPYFNDGTTGTDSPDYTWALGYSYNDDPKFTYCAEDMTTINGNVDWWLPDCGLSGGSSGGPWIQPMDTASGGGPIISINSWSYIGSPGMAGPRLVNNSAQCLMQVADTQWAANTADGYAGIIESSCP